MGSPLSGGECCFYLPWDSVGKDGGGAGRLCPQSWKVGERCPSLYRGCSPPLLLHRLPLISINQLLTNAWSTSQRVQKGTYWLGSLNISEVVGTSGKTGSRPLEICLSVSGFCCHLCWLHSQAGCRHAVRSWLSPPGLYLPRLVLLTERQHLC